MELTPETGSYRCLKAGCAPFYLQIASPGLAELLVSVLDAESTMRSSAEVCAEVMRRVVEEEERKEAAEKSVAAGGLFCMLIVESIYR
jgi:hypothetical protein